VRTSAAPDRNRPHTAASGRWASEWTSLLPPLLLWAWAIR
jgi:hypothetical protein